MIAAWGLARAARREIIGRTISYVASILKSAVFVATAVGDFSFAVESLEMNEARENHSSALNRMVLRDD